MWEKNISDPHDNPLALDTLKTIWEFLYKSWTNPKVSISPQNRLEDIYHIFWRKGVSPCTPISTFDNLPQKCKWKSNYAKHMQTNGHEKKKYRIFILQRVLPKYKTSRPPLVHQQAGKPDAVPPISVSWVRGSKVPLN